MVVTLLLLVHAAATLFMTGVIWFVQVVHYPLFAAVGADGFREYQARHLALTGRVVIPGMLVEVATGVPLVLVHPASIPAMLPALGLVLLVLIWGSTFFLQVPRHRTLEGGFSAGAWARLVRSNWVRTALWSGRGILVLAMVALEVLG